MTDSPRTYGTQPRDREQLIVFMVEALEAAGCRILHRGDARQAPFRITFVTPTGGRMGIVAYAFLATETPTKNRPEDEHSFQVKYGSKDGELHEIWQDPYGLYTTVFVGINPVQGFFVGADPVLHNPTKFFIRVEFKQHNVDAIRSDGWTAWERKRASSSDEPIEILVGGTKASFFRYVCFERDALGEDQGHRQLLAEKSAPQIVLVQSGSLGPLAPSQTRLHELTREFEMDESAVLDLIANARRLKMAVRGWVAEEHLVRHLKKLPGVSNCEKIDDEGGPDVRLSFEGSRAISIECKNVLRKTTATNIARVDFQRTRASKNDPCSRYYAVDDFDVVAACLHAVTEKWEFRFAQTTQLDVFTDKCAGKLSNLVKVDSRWSADADSVLRKIGHAG